MIVTTYPPPDSGSSGASSFDQLAADTLQATQVNEYRRESDWSNTTGETSRRGSDMPLLSARTKVERVMEDDELPLCAFVVDDDRYVLSQLFPFFSFPPPSPLIPPRTLVVLSLPACGIISRHI